MNPDVVATGGRDDSADEEGQWAARFHIPVWR